MRTKYWVVYNTDGYLQCDSVLAKCPEDAIEYYLGDDYKPNSAFVFTEAPLWISWT